MGFKCIVFGCSNTTGSYNKGERSKSMLYFHRFPTDIELRNIWIKEVRVNRAGYEWKSSHRICSDHFDRLQYENDPEFRARHGYFSRPILKPDAIPTKCEVPLTPLERKKTEDRERLKTRIYITDCFEEWVELKREKNFENDYQLCRFLLNSYYLCIRDHLKEPCQDLQVEIESPETAPKVVKVKGGNSTIEENETPNILSVSTKSENVEREFQVKEIKPTSEKFYGCKQDCEEMNSQSVPPLQVESLNTTSDQIRLENNRNTDVPLEPIQNTDVPLEPIQNTDVPFEPSKVSELEKLETVKKENEKQNSFEVLKKSKTDNGVAIASGKFAEKEGMLNTSGITIEVRHKDGVFEVFKNKSKVGETKMLDVFHVTKESRNEKNQIKVIEIKPTDDKYYTCKKDHEKEPFQNVLTEVKATELASKVEIVEHHNNSFVAFELNKREELKTFETKTNNPEDNEAQNTFEITEGSETEEAFEGDLEDITEEDGYALRENEVCESGSKSNLPHTSRVTEEELKSEEDEFEDNNRWMTNVNDSKHNTVEQSDQVSSDAESSEIEEPAKSCRYNLRRKRKRKSKRSSLFSAEWSSDCEHKHVDVSRPKNTKKTLSEDEDYMLFNKTSFKKLDEVPVQEKAKKKVSVDDDYMPDDKTSSDSDFEPSDLSETETDIPNRVQRKPSYKKSTNSQKKPRLCPVCGVSITSTLIYREHMFLEHTEEGAKTGERYKCQECNKGFRRYTTFYRHNRAKHQQRVCEDCGEMCVNSIELRDHKKVVHGYVFKKPKRFECSMCELKFDCKSKRDLHYRSKHLRKKEFRCSWEGCDKLFANRWAKTIHERIHTDDKPIVCELCGDQFRQKNSYSYHMKHKHNSTDNNGK